ncbi:hypothetical protein F5Y04DRAFT_257850 [Hypomontagnella monticulosa]|nr:hypothetical protein F5Y04DRAFT_257850 [Hypomontagnella monticulosa]
MSGQSILHSSSPATAPYSTSTFSTDQQHPSSTPITIPDDVKEEGKQPEAEASATATEAPVPVPVSGPVPEIDGFGYLGLPNSLLKRKLASADEYELRMGEGWTINDGTFAHVPTTKRRKRDVPYPVYINEAHRSQAGLSNLQISHRTPIHPNALDVAVNHVRACLPADLKTQVNVFPPCGPDFWTDEGDVAQTMFEKTQRGPFLNSDGKSYYAGPKFRSRPWGLWPLWIEDQWGKNFVLAVWCLSRLPSNDGSHYDFLHSCALYDPRRDPEVGEDGKHGPLIDRHYRIMRQLCHFFERVGIHVNEGSSDMVMGQMAPMAFDECSSAERVFSGAKEIMQDHLMYKWIHGILTPGPEDILHFNLPRWVNAYAARVEMTGICAWVLMASFNYDARIAVERLDPDGQTEVVMDGERKMIPNYDLAGPFQQPDSWFADKDYNLPASESGASGA